MAYRFGQSKWSMNYNDVMKLSSALIFKYLKVVSLVKENLLLLFNALNLVFCFLLNNNAFLTQIQTFNSNFLNQTEKLKI